MTAAMFDVWMRQPRRGHLSVVIPQEAPTNGAYGAGAADAAGI